MRAVVLFLILVFAFMVWRVTHNPPLSVTEPVQVEHPVAECPGCVGPSVDKQPQPVYPKDMHEDYVPTTKPPKFTPVQPGPPFAPKFGAHP